MDGRAFLVVAQELVAGPTEAHWRASVGRSYYALMLEGRDRLLSWGLPVPPRQNVHSWVRLKLLYAKDGDLKAYGKALDRLVSWRNEADYHLSTPGRYATRTAANQAIAIVQTALAALDQIEADPARRATAIASLPP
jgi:hypothetical protein